MLRFYLFTLYEVAKNFQNEKIFLDLKCLKKN